MPLVEVTLTEGRSPEQLRSLITGLSHAVVESIDAPLQNVRVIVREVPGTHFAAGDVTIAERNHQAATDTPSGHQTAAGTASGHQTPAGTSPGVTP